MLHTQCLLSILFCSFEKLHHMFSLEALLVHLKTHSERTHL